MDYGIRVSNKGYDVKTCPDDKLLFSSSFQTLKIYNTYSVNTTIPASGTNTITITHNLGFFAPFIIFYNGSTSLGNGFAYMNSDSAGNSLSEYWVIGKQTTNSLTLSIPNGFDPAVGGITSGSKTGDTVYFSVYIFLDDFRTVTEKIINNTIVTTGSSGDYGFRVSKPGFDVKTCSNKDCITSSSFPNQIIDKKGIYTLGVGETNATISQGLGYVPLALGWAIGNGNSYMTFITPKINNNQVIFTQRESNIGLGQGDKVNYIIFKNRNGS